MSVMKVRFQMAECSQISRSVLKTDCKGSENWREFKIKGRKFCFFVYLSIEYRAPDAEYRQQKTLSASVIAEDSAMVRAADDSL